MLVHDTFNMHRIALTISCLMLTISIFGQGKSALDLFRGDRVVADQYYDQMDYRNAIHFYEKVLEKRPDDVQSEFKIAKSYLHLNAPQQSEVWLRSIVNDPNATIDMKIMYAEILRRNNKIDQAKEWYAKVLQEENNPEIASKLDFLNNIDYYKRDSVYEVTNLDFNSEQSDFFLMPYDNGMIFLSSRQTERYIQHQPASAITDDEGMLRFFTKKDGNVAHFIYDEDVKPYYHDGPLSFYNDGKNVVFTRNNLRDATRSKGISRVNLKLYVADCSNPSTWTNIQPFEHNSDNYSVGHPAVASDGSFMFFSSDMPGGFGGPDLFVSFREGNKWGTPRNLGQFINTSGDELFPVLYNDTTLYFASSGLGGFGGLDLFTAKLNNKQLSAPKNMGTPINSPSDDFAMMMGESGREGYFSSNREGGTGLDDIYQFKTVKFSGVGKVLTKQTGSPIGNAVVTIESTDGNYQLKVNTDSSGIFKMELPYDADYLVSAAKEGHSDLFKSPYSSQGQRINYDTLVLTLWEHDLYAKGRLFSNETQEMITDVTITLENLITGVKDSIVSEDGNYSFPLAPDSKYKITAKHDGFIANGYSINTEKLYAGDLLNDILLEEVYVNKLVIYFEFDSDIVKVSDKSQMKQLIRTLKRYPESIINIAAHADARGSETYNKRLSEGRLQSTIRYFVQNGISRKRIKGIAFGEELLLNQCSSGVECGEEDHGKNRRAELKVQMNALH